MWFNAQSYPQNRISNLWFRTYLKLKKGKDPEFREHTCLYFKNLDDFKILNLVADNFNTMPELRSSRFYAILC